MSSIGEARQRPDVVAAERGGDPEQGMTGEPEAAAAGLDEARFWRDTYAEILHMEEQVLSRVHELMGAQSPAVRREVEASNVSVLSAQLERFRHRHDFWVVRVQELG